jgi:N-acyl-D-aspartate/D-glutamate deacylase
MGLDTTLNPFCRNPVYRPLAGLPVSEQLRILRTPGFEEDLLAAHAELHRTGRTEGRMIYSYERIFELGDPPDYEPGPARSIQARADRARVEPAKLMFDILTDGDGENLLWLALNNERAGDLTVNHELLDHPSTVIGLSDAGAHVGMIADGSFPTTLLSHWGRDREGQRFDIPRLVKMHTAETAALVGLHDRGVLEPGRRADLNVIDLEHLRLRKPRVVHDLPGGSRRFVQEADGYVHTFVAGQETYRRGEFTGALPGRLVRGGAF